MIKHMFVFGVIIPTVITIFLFVCFLICWFKFNMKERFFAKKKFFSKQIKQAMAPNQSGSSKQSQYCPETNGSSKHDPNKKWDKSDHPNGPPCINVPKNKKQKQYDPSEDQGHFVAEDPEAALCRECEDEHEHSELQGFSNPNLCVSPSHSSHSADGGDEHTETEDQSDNDIECVSVKKVGSMIQHTFHFPASEGPHLNNSLAVDSEDGGSEDGNYSHFVPLSQLLLDPKAKQLYAAARNQPDSPCSELNDCLHNGDAGLSTSIA